MHGPTKIWFGPTRKIGVVKLLFSEQKSDYEHYQFPYAIWAVPEAGETPADIFNAGFLPSSRQLDRFYLCRQVRVNLAKFKVSSENRRILRKGESINSKLLPRSQAFPPSSHRWRRRNRCPRRSS